MTTIASPQNPRLQALRRLHRRRERARSGRFLAEGEDLIAAAAHAGWQSVEGYRAAGSGLGEGFLDVEPAALAAVSTLGSGTRAIGVYEERWSTQLAGPLWVYLHGLSDPGNVGAILRAAHAFGASGVALGPDCADPFSPKAVRASMGAIFAVPLARVADVARAAGRADRAGRARRRAAAERPRRRTADTARRRRARGSAGRRRRGLRARRAHPDRRRLAQRRDGGDHRAVRNERFEK